MVPRDHHLLRTQRILQHLGRSPNMLRDFPAKPKLTRLMALERSLMAEIR